MPPLHTQPLCAHCSYNAERRTAPHPPPMAVPLPRRGRFCVVPFNRMGCIRHVPGTAHRPFPTVSLIGLFLNRRISKTDTSIAPIIVHCPLSIVNSKQLSTYTPRFQITHARRSPMATKDRILDLLLSCRGSYLSGEELAISLGVSRAVLKAGEVRIREKKGSI